MKEEWNQFKQGAMMIRRAQVRGAISRIDAVMLLATLFRMK